MFAFDSPFGVLDDFGDGVTKLLFVSSFLLFSADLWDLLAGASLSCFIVTSSCTSKSISLSQLISLIASGRRDDSETAFAAFIIGKWKLRSRVYCGGVLSLYAPTDYCFLSRLTEVLRCLIYLRPSCMPKKSNTLETLSFLALQLFLTLYCYNIRFSTWSLLLRICRATRFAYCYFCEHFCWFPEDLLSLSLALSSDGIVQSLSLMSSWLIWVAQKSCRPVSRLSIAVVCIR